MASKYTFKVEIIRKEEPFTEGSLHLDGSSKREVLKEIKKRFPKYRVVTIKKNKVTY